MVECIYQNDTSRMVIMKCIGSSQFYLEKVIMPSEIFLFNAPQEARLEIWRMSISGQMLTFAQTSVTTKRLREIQTLRN